MTFMLIFCLTILTGILPGSGISYDFDWNTLQKDRQLCRWEGNSAAHGPNGSGVCCAETGSQERRGAWVHPRGETAHVASFWPQNRAPWAPLCRSMLSYVCSCRVPLIFRTHHIVSQLGESQPPSMCEEACSLELQVRNLIRNMKNTYPWPWLQCNCSCVRTCHWTLGARGQPSLWSESKRIEGFICCKIATQRAGDTAQWLRRALAVLTEDLSLGSSNQAGRLTNVPKSSVDIYTHANLCIHTRAIKN